MEGRVRKDGRLSKKGRRFQDRRRLVRVSVDRAREKAVVLGFRFNRFLLDDQSFEEGFFLEKAKAVVLRPLAVFSRNRIWFFPSTLVGKNKFLLLCRQVLSFCRRMDLSLFSFLLLLLLLSLSVVVVVFFIFVVVY